MHGGRKNCCLDILHEKRMDKKKRGKSPKVNDSLS